MESTLAGIIPSYTAGPLPKALTDLAAALYTQSRNKAAALKPEEEIARSYVCCHLACDRLKQRLNLPKIEPRPPCPPRIYKKLYQFLDKALPSKLPAQATSTPATPTKQGRRAGVQPSTPVVKASPTTASTRGTGRKRKLEEVAENSSQLPVEDGTLPDWIGNAVKHISNMVGVPTALPHVYVGLSTLLRDAYIEEPRSKRGRGPTPKKNAAGIYTLEKLPALLCALLVVVARKLQGEESSSDELMASAVAELVGLGQVVTTGVDDILDQTDEYLDKHKEEWLQMAWYANIRGAQDNDLEHDPRDIDDLEDADVSDSRQTIGGERSDGDRVSSLGTMQYGSGTMMQERIDWLSADRQAQYARWKARILGEIERLEAGQQQISNTA